MGQNVGVVACDAAEAGQPRPKWAEAAAAAADLIPVKAIEGQSKEMVVRDGACATQPRPRRAAAVAAAAAPDPIPYSHTTFREWLDELCDDPDDDQEELRAKYADFVRKEQEFNIIGARAAGTAMQRPGHGG